MSARLMTTVMIASCLISCSDYRNGPTDNFVNVGSHSLHAVVSGKGSPAVVFDGGIGTASDEYRQIQDRISSAATMVTYDRAGYGASDGGPLPRDSRTESGELRVLLAELGIDPPYILVGHSLRGLNVEVYADLYPEEVAGMILLDPPPLSFLLGQEYPQLGSMAQQMTDQWQGIADRGFHSAIGQERAEAVYFQMLASEHREMFAASARQAASIESFGSIPLVVVASGVPNQVFGIDAEAFQTYWAAQSKVLSEKSAHGLFIHARPSTHRLHDDAQDLVVDTILSMLKSLEKRQR